MLLRSFVVLYAGLLSCVVSSQNQYPPINTSGRTCFATRPGTANNSNKVVNLGVRNWLSHKLSSALLEIVLREYLGFSLNVSNITSANEDEWGKQISEGSFDVDIESWRVQASSVQYTKYVTTQKTVIDAGLVGYYARKGFFTTPQALTTNPMVTYYEFYKDAAAVKAANYVMFGEDDLKGFVVGKGGTWPICDASHAGFSWCGTGSLDGYWAPPACLGNESDCAVAFLGLPTDDKGRFEQLTANHGLYFIHGWAGTYLPAKVKEVQASGKEAIFKWWTPDAFPLSVGARRISFPDWEDGCDSTDTQSPSGTIACDNGVLPLNKVITSKLRTEAPAAHILITKFEIMEQSLNDIIAKTKEAGGSKEPFDAACEWLQVNNATVASWVPACATNPVAAPKTGDLVFDPFTLQCKAVMAFPETLINKTCIGPISPTAPGKDQRALQVIRAVYRYWSTQQISASILLILLKDMLGYSVKSVAVDAPDAEIVQQMDGEAYDVDVESWYASQLLVPSLANMAANLIDLGSLGYSGRSGMFVSKATASRDKFTKYYKFYQDKANIAKMNFPMFGDWSKPGNLLPTPKSFDTSFPSCSLSWCENTTNISVWTPPHCKAKPEDCPIVFHPTSSYDTAYFEQLSKNFNLHAAFAYYGWGVPDLIKKFVNHGAYDVIFYWWVPDDLVAAVNGQRISFPDAIHGCTAGNNQNANTGTLSCDYSWIALAKVARLSIQMQMPEAYALIMNFTIWQPDIEYMLTTHSNAGGPFTTFYDVACDWVKNNMGRINTTLAPPCLSSPKLTSQLIVGDSVFDKAKLACVTIACGVNDILLTSAIGVTCKPCGVGQIPQGNTACQSCSAGYVPNRTSGTCMPCSEGFFCKYGAELPTPCEPGTFQQGKGKIECIRCPVGAYASGMNSTACIQCSAGTTTEYLGASFASDCKCSEGFYTSGGSACIPCPEGMTCAIGSSLINITSTAMNHAAPRLKKGYWSDPGAPVSVFKCQDSDSCPGGLPGTCSDINMEGRMCSECKTDYRRSGSKCIKCAHIETTLVLFPVMTFVLGPVVVWALYNRMRDEAEAWGSWKNGFAALFLLLLGHYQTLALIPETNLSISVDLRDFWKPFGASNDLISIVSPECAALKDFQASFTVRTLSPGLVLVIFIDAYVTLLPLRCFNMRHRSMDGDRLFNVYCGLLFAFYVGIVKASMSLFVCNEHPNGDWTLAASPSVRCGEDKWKQMIVVAVVSLVFFCLASLAVFVYIIMIAPVHFHKRAFRRKWKFLIMKYRPKVWWWGVMWLLKGLLVNFALLFTSPFGQLSGILLAIALYLMVVVSFKPWRHGAANVMEFCACTSIMVAVYMALADASYLADKQPTMVLGAICSLTPFLAALILGFGLFVRSFSQNFERSRANILQQHLLYSFQMFSKLANESAADMLLALPSADRHVLCEAADILLCECTGQQPRRSRFGQRLNLHSDKYGYAVSQDLSLDQAFPPIKIMTLVSRKSMSAMSSARCPPAPPEEKEENNETQHCEEPEKEPCMMRSHNEEAMRPESISQDLDLMNDMNEMLLLELMRQDQAAATPRGIFLATPRTPTGHRRTPSGSPRTPRTPRGHLPSPKS